MISGVKLGNRCKIMLVYDLLRAVIPDFGPRLANQCREEKWFRLQRPQRQRGPRPILIFAAATENGFACYGRSGNEVRIRF